MLTIDRILCPVDLSDESKRAFDYALAMGRRFEAEVRVVHVVDMGAWIGLPVEGIGALAETARLSLREQLDWWVARNLTGGAEVRSDLREGPVVSGILAAATELQADVIVMGTHGRSGFARLALGSVTERVLRKATCPAIVVPAREDAVVRTGQLGRVVCATDFSEASRQAVAYAKDFAAAGSSPLTLMTVIDWPFGDSSGSDPVTRLRESLEQEATDSLAALKGAPTEHHIDVAVRRGKAGAQIVNFARDVHAELVVLGVSGRGALDRALLGSTAHQVLRDAPCPVLTVPMPARA